MKRSILFFISFCFIIFSVQAQRRYDHLKRIKIEKTNTFEDKEEKTIPIHMEIINVDPSLSVGIPEPHEAVFVNPTSPVNMIIEISHPPKQKKVTTTNNVPSSFFQQVFKTHKKLSEVKEIEKTNLRTWKWLVIAAAILVAIGILLLILVSNLPHPAASFAYAFGLGCVVIGVLLIVIFLILGLNGRI